MSDDELDLGELFGFSTGDWPTTGRVVYEAPSGRSYHEVDAALLGPDVRAKTEPLLAGFARGGVEPVGDLVCDDSPNILIRGLAGDRLYAVLVVPPHVSVVTEVYSRFDDGSSLTTTTNPFGGLGGPDRGIFRNAQPADATAEQLLAAHEDAVSEHGTDRGTLPLPVHATLEGLAESFDEFVRRQTA